ncbi:MAG: two-component system response regulator RstA [Myxococcota bacterium]|jgi:two-component system response regulator RstA
MDAPARILLVDDDMRLTALVADYLRREGLEVGVVNDGRLAVERILAERPDVVVLDLMLPGEDGLSICRRVREEFGGAILMLTARSDDVDQVVGLELGADDYVVKPVSPRLLLARIRAMLRRGRPEVDRGRLEVGGLVVNQRTRTARVGEAVMTLTTGEFDLLWCLARHAGRPLSREALLKELRGIRYDGLDRSIDVRVSQLRRKLRTFPGAPEVKTVRGVGYQLVSE